MKVDVLGVAIDGQNKRQANADFGSGYSDDEQGEHFAADRCAGEGTEGHRG